MNNDNVEPHARLIAALSETMRNNLWATDIENRCSQILREVEKILYITRQRHGGER
jgi:hypothetical protein